jgi:hypothetical protein
VIVFMSFSPDSRILQVKITTEEANLRSRTIAGAGLHVLSGAGRRKRTIGR